MLIVVARLLRDPPLTPLAHGRLSAEGNAKTLSAPVTLALLRGVIEHADTLRKALAPIRRMSEAKRWAATQTMKRTGTT